MDPSYDWRPIDLAVTRTVEAGLTPVAMIYEAPSWAEGCRSPADAPESACDPSPAALAAFSTAAARRYSGYFEARECATGRD